MYVDVPCALCGSTRRSPVYPATKPPEPLRPDELACATAPLARYDAVVRCLDCGLLYTSPRPSDEDLAAGYTAVADQEFLGERRARELTYRRLLKSLDRYATLHRVIDPVAGGRRKREGGLKLLDAGCAMGFFLNQARADGWDVEGIDPSRWAAGYARREFGLTVHNAPLASVELQPASYDVITLWDVVEHLPHPVTDLAHLAKALKPGGLFALSTHSIGSLSARVLGPRYPFLMAMHVTHFNRRTIGDLFERAGMRMFRMEPQLRSLRVGYLIKKLGQRLPKAAAVMKAVAGPIGLLDRHVPVTGLGIFNAYARKH
jgi:SAM-dependent methyltransferase